MAVPDSSELAKIEIVKKLVRDAGGRLEIKDTDLRLTSAGISLKSAKLRSYLVDTCNLVVSLNSANGVFTIDTLNTKANNSTPAGPAVPEVFAKVGHEYVPPAILEDIKAALADAESHVLLFAGPTQCGKTSAAKYLANKLNMEFFQINCQAGMGLPHFVGQNVIEIDKETQQNKIVFREGTMVKAMKCGLDAHGNEIPGAKPGLLLIDESAAMTPQVAIALNGVLESDDNRRRICLDEDGGRVVRSHSGFRILLAANTNLRGTLEMNDTLHTAQTDALDISTIMRISMVFWFKYDVAVEKRIMLAKLGNDNEASKLYNFTQGIRESLAGGQLTTPFSTGHLIKICNAYRIFKRMDKAIFYTVFGKLLREERTVYNEKALAIYGFNIEKNMKDF